jgi:hypothetical protein
MNALATNKESSIEVGPQTDSSLDASIAGATVLDKEGQAVPLGQLLNGQRSLLVFIRHYG